MKHLVLGLGEVGKALYTILSDKRSVFGKDLGPEYVQGKERKPCTKPEVDILHICLNFHGLGAKRFNEVVDSYISEVKPMALDICSTVTPGTTERFEREWNLDACHSTTRGLHPNLVDGLLKVPKHVGGPKAAILAAEFAKCGIRCVTHGSARTTELLHIINNVHYGVNLAFADEAARLCREYGVDYWEYMRYTATHNEGFRTLDHARLARPILTPPNGCIGGHCVTQGASLIPGDRRGPLFQYVADFNDPVRRADVETLMSKFAVQDGLNGESDGCDVPDMREGGDLVPLDGQADPGGEAAGGGVGSGEAS